jgi:hypothetical protein
MKPSQLNKLLQDASPDVKAAWAKACERQYGKPTSTLDEMGWNKSERAYADHLERKRLAGEIKGWEWTGKSKAHRLSIGAGRHYKPDFYVTLLDGEVEIHEVKGRKFDGGMVRFDMAAKENRQYVFRMFQLDRRLGWMEVRTWNQPVTGPTLS